MEPEQVKNEVAIVVVTYNISDLIRKQVECIRRFCKDNHDIIIVDNSTEKSVIESIHYHARDLGCGYIKTNATSCNDSFSHSFAANTAYAELKNKYKYFCFLDHDNFPVKNFSIKEMLSEKIIAGLGQVKPSGKEYFWPGCVMWNNQKIENGLIDFNPNLQFGLDTGGNFYKIIEKYGKENCIFLNEAYNKNGEFNKSFYDFYSTINDEMFMHFINSSNWAKSADNVERVNSLLNILEQRLKINSLA